MTDLAYAFTLSFVTLGPLKTIPEFFLTTQSLGRRTVLMLAAKSTVLATSIVLFIATVVSGALVTWRVSIEAVAIAGGLVLLITSIKDLSSFPPERPTEFGPPAARSAAMDTSWLGRPVLSPLTIPAIVPPIGVVVVLFLAGTAVGDARLQARLVSLLLAIMAVNFVAMIFAGPIMRLVPMPVLQVVGWVFSVLQAGLAIQIIINSVQTLR